MLLALLGVSILLGGILAGYLFGWNGAGVHAVVGPSLPPNTTYYPNKTLWDWLQLLIAPLMLAGIGYWLTSQQKARDERAAAQQQVLEQSAQTFQRLRDEHATLLQQQETALQGAIDRISALITHTGLRADASPAVARAHTLTALRRLDGERKGLLLNFLADAGLVGNGKVMMMPAMNLAMNLAGADLSEARLSKINMAKCSLNGAHLERADLSRASLEGANLSWARLEHANLSGAHLEGANLGGSYLKDTNLRGAYLQGADLRRAYHLKGIYEAKYDSKTKWPHGYDPTKFGGVPAAIGDVAQSEEAKAAEEIEEAEEAEES
jgi:uncharacterized protein YjbI with pentapeptide repeats